ncbi:MAG: HEAT repeat domain-containing protein [Phycisphaerales bacterium]
MNRTELGAIAATLVLASAAILLGGCAAPTSTAGSGVPNAYLSVRDDAAVRATLRRDAIEYLRALANDESPLLRANAIEALQSVPMIGEQLAREGLVDPNPGVRFVATMSIAELGGGSSPLLQSLLRDPDPSVQAAAILALRNHGSQVNLSSLAEMLRSGDLTTRGNAALVLGEIGDPSAIPMLREALTYDLPTVSMQRVRVVQLQIAEALIKLGDSSALERVRVHLVQDDNSEGEVRALAAQITGRVGDERSRDLLVSLVARWRQYRVSAEVRLAAMAALAQLGEPPSVTGPLEYFEPAYRDAPAAIRAQAVYTLGEIGGPDAWAHLARIFRESGEEMVRVHAAAAIVASVPPADGESVSGL